MSQVASSRAEDLQWTIRVNASASTEGETLVVHGRNLWPLVARLLADERVRDIVVRPRDRQVTPHVPRPAEARREK